MKEINKNTGLWYSNGISISDLNEAQKENKFIIPSDYIYLLLNTDGIRFERSYQISIDKKHLWLRLTIF
jgi:hypothetical protein